MWVVVPVKSFELAKRRLAAVLSTAERIALARVMLTDVLGTLTSAQRVSGVMIVSREPEAERIAVTFGATFVAEQGAGLSNAVQQGALRLMAGGRRSFLMIPGDVPLATPAEIDRLIGQHTHRPAVSIVPDLEGAGTNGIAISPPDLITLAFGAGSFRAHEAAAAAAGVKVNVVNLPGLALDIDTPDDLRRLITYESESETLSHLCDHDLVSRLTQRDNQQALRAGHEPHAL